MYVRTGGPLVYAEEAMGKTASFTVGWMVWKTLSACRNHQDAGNPSWSRVLCRIVNGGFREDCLAC